MLSNLHLDHNIIPNDVEQFNPSEFSILDSEDFSIVKSPEEIDKEYLFRKLLEYAITNSGSYNLSPFSFNFNHHSQIYSIFGLFKEYTNTIALSSCRLDAIARDPYLVELINYFGAVNITVAIEGISQRVRNYLQKSLLEEDIYVGMNHTIKQPFNEIKLYYIYTGHETVQDLVEFEKFLQTIDELRRHNNKATQEFRLSFTPFLPTLGTPSQYHGSNVGRSMKDDVGVLHKIKQTVNKFGFGVRLSTTVPVNELSVMMEMTDRRAAPLFSYASLNGLFNFPKYSSFFYKGEKEVTKEKYKKLPSEQRMHVGVVYYKVDFLDRANIHKVYKSRNEKQLFEEHNILDIIKELKSDADSGEVVSEKVLANFPESRAKYIKGSKVKLVKYPAEELIHTYKNGKKVFFLRPINISEISMDLLKKYLPIVTNGVTYNDICAHKDPLHVFPNMHIKFHKNKHMGQDLRQHAQNREYLFNSYCIKDSLSYCIGCGACSSVKEVKHITVDSTHELGKDHFEDKIIKQRKSFETTQKLLVEIKIDSGPPTAMQERWLRYAINAIVLKASRGELVKALIGERLSNSRQVYKIKQDNFRSLLAGSYIQELSFNDTFVFDQEYLDWLLSRINKFTTKGWNVIALKHVTDPKFVMKSNLHYALTTFRFDSRKVKVTFPQLRDRVEKFFDNDTVVKYKVQKVETRFSTKVEEIDFDKSQILHLVAGVGSNPYESILRVFGKVHENHPLIFLSGFLSKNGKTKSYASLLGTEIILEGFYQAPKNSSSIFDASEDSDLAITCPRCGGPKFTNFMNGKPFGNGSLNYEELKDHPKICQFCFSELAP